MSPRVRRRYGLPLEGPTGLDPKHEALLRHLDSRHTVAEMKRVLLEIPELSSLVQNMTGAIDPEPDMEVMPVPISVSPSFEEEVRNKHGIPPSGPSSINDERVRQLVILERKIRRPRGDSKGNAAESRRWAMRGILAEQRFISAWTHDGFCQPGVKLVRGCTPDEDSNKIDAVMETTSGQIWKFQVKTGLDGSARNHARKGIVLVRIKHTDPPELIRSVAIMAMVDYLRLRKEMGL